MTNPANVGDIYAKLHVDGDDAPSEMKHALEKAGAENEATANRIGQDHAKEYADGWSKASNEHLRNKFGADLQKVLGDIRDDVHRSGGFDIDIFDDVDLERKARRSGEGFFRGFFGRIRDLFDKESGPLASRFGNIFSSVVGGPVGAFFNVGGRSPLIALLIPLLGYIVALITAAVYGLQAFVALLYLIPSLLFAIGLQGAALFFIFSGLSDVISAAFAATNAEELEKALEGVNGQVAEFVRALLPWRDFFRQLKVDAQFAFFDFLDASKITAVLDSIRGPFAQAIVNIAAAFGNVANSLLDVFASPAFAELINVIGTSTVQWLAGFGPALANFIDGLNQLGIAIDPFLDWFGGQFNETISSWGDFLKGLGSDPMFLDWVEDAKQILGDFMELLGSITMAVIVFLRQFSEADKQIQERFGMGFLDFFTEMTKAFTDFLASPAGREAFEGFIYLLLILVGSFYGLAIALLGVTAAVVFLGKSIGAFFEWLGGTAIPRIGDFFSMLGDIGEHLAFAFEIAWYRISHAVGDFFDQLGTNFHDSLEKIKKGIGDWFDQLGTNFYYSGINLIMRLVDGIDAALPFLNLKMDQVGKAATSHLNQSPAEVGPLSGKGDPLLSGKTLVQRLATGIEMEIPALNKAMNSATSNLVFGTGSIQVNYYGNNPPSTSQATAMGTAVGNGINSQIASTQLAVRMI